MKRSKIARSLDYLDDQLIEGAMENPTKHSRNSAHVTPSRKINLWQKWAAVAAAVVLLISGAVGGFHVIGGNIPSTVVALDVNPSLEIEINDKEQVVNVKALNEDAQKVIGDMNFKKVDLNVAINALIGSMLINGYLSVDKNSILISVDSDGKDAGELQQNISNNVYKLLTGSGIDALVISQKFNKEDAHGEGVSTAKTTLINKILAIGLTDKNGTAYTYEQLAALSINEIKLILDSKSLSIEEINTNGTASEEGLIGQEEALRISLEKAQVTKDEIFDLDIDIDFEKEFSVLVYEVEFEFNSMEYEYKLNAKTGEILEEEIEPNENDDD